MPAMKVINFGENIDSMDGIINSEDEYVFMKTMLHDLLDYAAFVREQKPEDFILTRTKLNYIKTNAEGAEELLDAIGAKTNEQWHSLREMVSLLKNFSTSSYEAVHLKYSADYYGLGEYLDDFKRATDENLAFVTEIIRITLVCLYDEAEKLGVVPRNAIYGEYSFPEFGIIPHLEKNVKPRMPGDVVNHIISMAVNVLNTTEDVNNFRILKEKKVADWENIDFDFLCETRFRITEVRMQNLQSMYDTYIANSETENMDQELLTMMRGRISVVLHLMRIGSLYIHFYERHIRKLQKTSTDMDKFETCIPLMKLNCDEFRRSFIDYIAKFIYIFLSDARELCAKLLKNHCVFKTVEIKFPPYIGFHNRPSALVTAIAMHYGCQVTLNYSGTDYIVENNPLVLPPITERVNQDKREYVRRRLMSLDLSEDDAAFGSASASEKIEIIKRVILKLISMNVIKLYKMPLDTSILRLSDKPMEENVIMAIDRLNGDRQLGMIFDVNLTVSGPSQAVDDIAILAAANYCESETGVDLPIPKELDYLNLKRQNLTLQRQKLYREKKA